MGRRTGFLFGAASLALVLGGAWIVVAGDASASVDPTAPGSHATRPDAARPLAARTTVADPLPASDEPVARQSSGPTSLLPPEGYLAGRVLDGRGRPVQGATLRFRPVDSGLWALGRPPPSVVVVTDGRGLFEVDHLEEGDYRVSASRFGYRLAKQNVSSPLNHRLDFLLEDAPKTKLQIVDARTGLPVLGATLTRRVLTEELEPSLTNESAGRRLGDGTFLVTHPPAGDDSVWVGAPRYIQQRVGLTETRGLSCYGPTHVSGARRKVATRTIELHRAPEMTVTVTDAAGQPLPDVPVAVRGKGAAGVEGKTDGAGELRLIADGPGDWTVRVGSQSQVARIEKDDWTDVRFVLGR